MRVLNTVTFGDHHLTSCYWLLSPPVYTMWDFSVSGVHLVCQYKHLQPNTSHNLSHKCAKSCSLYSNGRDVIFLQLQSELSVFKYRTGNHKLNANEIAIWDTLPSVAILGCSNHQGSIPLRYSDSIHTYKLYTLYTMHRSRHLLITTQNCLTQETFSRVIVVALYTYWTRNEWGTRHDLWPTDPLVRADRWIGFKEYECGSINVPNVDIRHLQW